MTPPPSAGERVFADLFERVEARDRRLTVYAPAETDLAARFATRNATVVHREVGPDGPEPFVAIHEDDAFVGAIGLDRLENLLAPPVTVPDDFEGLAEGYRTLFDLLDETLFRGLARRPLLATSREIEDRAARVGRGVLRVSFQSFSLVETRRDRYRRLVDATDLDVHIYGTPDATPPELDVTYHGTDAVAPYWLLAFDGGGDDGMACALVARQLDDRYDGFWTYDPAFVDEISSRLASLAD